MSLFSRASTRSLSSLALRAALFIFGLFFCLALSLYYAENGILYRPQTTYTPPGTAKAAPGFQEIVVTNARKAYHYGWYAPATTKKQTLVFFHDGGDTINTMQASMTPFVLEGYGVLMVEYRGYGEVTGTPQEEDIYADSENFFDFLHEVNVSDKHMIIAGQGLGAAVALEMAKRHASAGVVLVSPFVSAMSYIRHKTSLPTFIPLLKDRYRNLDKIDKIHAPLLILAGQRDTLAPVRDAEILLKKAQDPKSLVLLPDVGHYDIMGRPFATNVLGWLSAQEAIEAPHSPQHPLNLNLSDQIGSPALVEKALQAPMEEGHPPQETAPTAAAPPQQ